MKTMNRRTFLAAAAVMASGRPLAASGSPQTPATDAERFAAIHAALFARWRSVEAMEDCGRTYCAKTLQQARQTLRGNCLDYGMVLIDECARQGVTGVAAVWCRCNGVAHLVVLHAPSGLVADNQVGSARDIGRRVDLAEQRIIWAGSGSWDGQDGRTW